MGGGFSGEISHAEEKFFYYDTPATKYFFIPYYGNIFSRTPFRNFLKFFSYARLILPQTEGRIFLLPPLGLTFPKIFGIIYLEFKGLHPQTGGDFKVSIKLDYTLQSPEERKELVEQILAETPEPSERYLETLADYLVLAMEKQERKEKKILTENRMATVNKRETSFEGLVSQFENGEDGIYNLVTEDKNQIFQHKVEITEQDLEEIPFLKQVREAIEMWEGKLKTATGRDAFIIKKAIIDLRKDQYIIKNAYRKPVVTMHASHGSHYVPLDYTEAVVDGEVQYSGASLLDYKVCSAVLCNYSKLKAAGEGNFMSDTWYFMEDFDRICGMALKDYPYYERLIEYKIDAKQNNEIQDLLQAEFGIRHSAEYISSLWRNKIPKLIAAQAEDEFLDWWYLQEEKGQYKRCTRCGQLKLANNKYFSKNKTSKDGYYSICKSCRNSKK